ncbi:MAG: nucleotidyl transferase AbiEii/AbiGii toxin family protein, partial [Candidatus Hodarchaeota archaeon]
MILETEGFSYEVLDKVYRIADVLQRLGHVPFLRSRMSFFGGTALNFIIFHRIERLSLDLDFNFREVSSQVDWNEDRSKVDEYIKQILYDLRYGRDDIKMNVSYPLTRFEVKYPPNKSFKIEIAYTRRFPVLPSDDVRKFFHPRTNETCEILIPKKEEIFGNKCSVLLARKTSRDLFDVSRIALQECNSELVRKILVLENMMQGKENFANI